MSASIETRHLAIPRRVRYAVLGPVDGPVRRLWFVLHGYGQLAHAFLRSFELLASGGRRIVAPEGLHRHYIDHAAREVGASWMTSEDRLTDIGDYVTYLDRLHGAILGEGAGDALRIPITALGFSQGVHTLCRWLAFGAARIDRAVLWGSTIPPDLDLEAHADALASVDLHVVFGDSDPHYGAEAVGEQEAHLSRAGIPFRAWSFAGGHRLDDDTLRALARLEAG